MSQFTSNLIVELVKKKTWRLAEGFEYHVGDYPSDEIIKVPVGFITDFASVPLLFWPLIPPVGVHGKAAVIHDYCYATACYSREKSDKIFLEAMEVLGVKKWRRLIMYWTVSMFGGWAWHNHRRRELLEKEKENK